MKTKSILNNVKNNYLMHTQREKGITLIALVVTIIVLLILAGIALNLTIGENGIINKSKLATEKWEEASKNEQGELEKAEEAIDEYLTNNGQESGGEKATATPEDVLKGKTYYTENGTLQTGTLDTLDTSDATATSEDILNGKTAYARGEKITGTYDQNSTIIDLGIGRTFDLTGYSNYKEFTTDNFICEPINNSLPKWAGDIQGPRRFGSGINFSKNYNQETGILSATAYAVTYYMNSSNQFEGTYATSDFDVHAYLIK